MLGGAICDKCRHDFDQCIWERCPYCGELSPGAKEKLYGKEGAIWIDL